MIKQITRAGYEYQDLIGIRELLKFYRDKNLYDHIKLEFPDNGQFRALDDVVCKIKNKDKFTVIQVKFSVDGDKYKCDWNWLTSKKENGTSLIQKWGNTVLNLLSQNKLLEAKIVTNKLPDDEISNFFEDNKISWTKIPNDKKEILIKQLGSGDDCKLFFDNCDFEFLGEDLYSLDNNLFNEYSEISESRADWSFLKEFVKNHSISSDNEITQEILSNLLQCRPPKPLNQDFFVPENYIPPDKEFHKNLLSKIKNNGDNYMVITGSPGVGKSTYISYLKSELEKENIFVIRHHYYLSNDSKEAKRYRYFDIKNSLLEQINGIFSVKFHDKNELETVLKNISGQLNDKQLVIIIDGLDHVWRDIGKKDDLDTLFYSVPKCQDIFFRHCLNS